MNADSYLCRFSLVFVASFRQQNNDREIVALSLLLLFIVIEQGGKCLDT